MNLFVIYIGGAHPRSFIEVHDMRFLVANAIEDTYENLRQSWWGTPESLHLDAWGILRYTDGYEIHIKNESPTERENKLFFVNLGGYDKDEFTELHKNVFVVAPTESKAKVKALKKILTWKAHHRDYQFEVEKVMNVQESLMGEELFIHLVPCKEEILFDFTCKYVSINR